MSQSNLPKSILCLRHYELKKLPADLLAGVTVGLVALPLAMAFAISSGVPPQAGLYTAVVAGFLISALGGSRTQIGGPTGAFVVVVYGIVAKHGIDGLFLCTLMAGLILILLGLTGLGKAVKIIPRPVIVGFTNGIAVLIASTQIKDFLGLSIENVPGDFIGRMESLAANLGTWSWQTAALACASSRGHSLLSAFRAPRAWLHCGSRGRHDRCCIWEHSRRDHRHAVRRHSHRFADFRATGNSQQHDCAIDSIGTDRSPAGGHRIAALGRGGRPDERRSAQLEC